MVGGVTGPAATYQRNVEGIVDHWSKEIDKFAAEIKKVEAELGKLGHKKIDYKELAKSKDGKVKALLARRDKAVKCLEDAKKNLEMNVKLIAPPSDVSEADEKALTKFLKTVFSKKGAKIAKWVTIGVKVEPKYDKKKKKFALKKLELTLKLNF